MRGRKNTGKYVSPSNICIREKEREKKKGKENESCLEEEEEKEHRLDYIRTMVSITG